MKVGRFFGRFLASVQIERVFVNPQEPCQSTCVHHRSKSHVHPAHWGQIPHKFSLFYKWEFFFLTEILIGIVQESKETCTWWHFWYVWSFMARIPLIETRICIQITKNSWSVQKGFKSFYRLNQEFWL